MAVVMITWTKIVPLQRVGRERWWWLVATLVAQMLGAVETETAAEECLSLKEAKMFQNYYLLIKQERPEPPSSSSSPPPDQLQSQKV